MSHWQHDSTISYRLSSIKCAARDFKLPPRRVVIRYRRFGTPYRSHLHGSRNLRDPSDLISWPSKTRPTGCRETSVRNCHCAQRERPEKGGSHDPSSLSFHRSILLSRLSFTASFKSTLLCVGGTARWITPGMTQADQTVKLFKIHSVGVCACLYTWDRVVVHEQRWGINGRQSQIYWYRLIPTYIFVRYNSKFWLVWLLNYRLCTSTFTLFLSKYRKTSII